MKSKPKAPAKPIPARTTHPRGTAQAKAPALPQADSRWQRTVRYGWDKGGAKGGR